MDGKIYRFKCKYCSHEYVGDMPVMECPKCGESNKNDSTFIPKENEKK